MFGGYNRFRYTSWWEVAGWTGLILIVLFLAIFGPIFTIWALNLVFGLTIPVTWGTWAAVSWLCYVLNPTLSTRRRE